MNRPSVDALDQLDQCPAASSVHFDPVSWGSRLLLATIKADKEKAVAVTSDRSLGLHRNRNLDVARKGTNTDFHCEKVLFPRQ
jgi:hypothetical protein